jgi:hypothetical protein
MRFVSSRSLGGLVGAGLIALASLALAQVTQNQLTGNECWSVGQGPGGPSNFLCINVARGGRAQTVLSAVSGNFTIGATTGNFTVTGTPNMTALASGGHLLVNAQPSAATITMPANPIADGAIVGVCNVTGAAWSTNVVTLSANSGQTLAQTATLTTLAAGTCAREQWNQSQATWYRIQ